MSIPNNKVCPSGSARATNSVAILVEAPGRLSTTTDWTHRGVSLCANARASRSLPLPGVNPMTMRTGLDGQGDCACAPGAKTAAQPAAANATPITARLGERRSAWNTRRSQANRQAIPFMQFSSRPGSYSRSPARCGNRLRKLSYSPAWITSTPTFHAIRSRPACPLVPGPLVYSSSQPLMPRGEHVQ